MATPARTSDLYDLLVFDLDGTLADTREDIAASLNQALLTLGRTPFDLATVTRFIGNGAPVLIRRALGEEPPQAEVERGLALFLDHYRAHSLERTVLYPGVGEVVRRLAGEGKRLAVLSNKPTLMSREILAGLGIGGHFARIEGGDGFPKKPDPEGLRAIMAALGAEPRRTLMAGDSGVDVQTGRAAGTAVAGCLWGFKPEEFRNHPPDHLLRRMEEILEPPRPVPPRLRSPEARLYSGGPLGNSGE